MNVYISVALDDEDEQALVQEFEHTYVDSVILEGRDHPLYKMRTLRLWSQVAEGAPLDLREWLRLLDWTEDMNRHARRNLQGDKKFSYDLLVQVRNLCISAIRLCKRSEPGAIAISPGP